MSNYKNLNHFEKKINVKVNTIFRHDMFSLSVKITSCLRNVKHKKRKILKLKYLNKIKMASSLPFYFTIIKILTNQSFRHFFSYLKPNDKLTNIVSVL